MQKRDNARKLRSPFVVTVAVAATTALAASSTGCGANVVPNTCDGSACNDVQAPSQCPASPPAQNSPCMPNGLSCSYNLNPNNDSCGVRPFQFFCNNGVWQGGISTCNPPPPMCPATMPANGAPCVGVLSCQYTMNTPCGPIPVPAMCTSGQWMVAGVSCNPPPPDAGPGPTDAGSAEAGSVDAGTIGPDGG